MQLHDIIRSCQEFPPVIPVLQVSPLRVTHPSAMVAMVQAPLPHRLACVKHSVSVHPEPGSNSSFNYFSSPYLLSLYPIRCFFPSYFFSSSYLSPIVLSNHSRSWQKLFYQILYSFVNTFFSLFFWNNNVNPLNDLIIMVRSIVK